MAVLFGALAASDRRFLTQTIDDARSTGVDGGEALYRAVNRILSSASGRIPFEDVQEARALLGVVKTRLQVQATPDWWVSFIEQMSTDGVIDLDFVSSSVEERRRQIAALEQVDSLLAKAYTPSARVPV